MEKHRSRTDAVREYLLYGGMSREEYRQISGEIQKSNRKNLLVYATVATVYLMVMYVLSFFSEDIASNREVYLGATVVAGAVLAAAKYLCGRHPRILLVSIYVFIGLLYTFGIILGTISNRDQLAVTFVAVLLTVPLLFVDCPLRMVASIGVFMLAFIVVVTQTKTGYVRTVDIIDVTTFGTMSMIASTYMMRVKCQRILFEQRALMLSQKDVLTGVNNRNFFERELQNYLTWFERNLTCIFVDADGLHELNNTQGHVAGDRMLRCVAENMIAQFGTQHTYRVGGDEFVAFAPDCQDLKGCLEALRQAVEAEGYHISVGFQTHTRDGIDMENLIRDAEYGMYEEKKRHYAEKGIVRNIR